MKHSENITTFLLGFWLIASALVSLLPIHVPIILNLVPILALISGILILLGTIKPNKSLGFLLLACWLILKGLTPFLYVRIPYFGYLVDLLGIIAGILILLKR